MTKHLTFKNILFATVIIFLIIVLVDCNGRNRRLEKVIAANAKLNQQRTADSINHLTERSRWQDSISHAALNSDLQVNVIKETEKKLQASQQSINRLTAIIRRQPGPVDSSFVLVSPAYKDACDSLPDKIDSQNMVIADLKQDNEDLVDLMNYEVVLRDSLIEVEQEQIGKLNNTIAGKNKIIEDALKAGKPRGRLLGGVGLIGNQTNPLGGTKVNIAYQSKGGKQYTIGGIIMQGGVWYEAGVFITLVK